MEFLTTAFSIIKGLNSNGSIVEWSSSNLLLILLVWILIRPIVPEGIRKALTEWFNIYILRKGKDGVGDQATTQAILDRLEQMEKRINQLPQAPYAPIIPSVWEDGHTGSPPNTAVTTFTDDSNTKEGPPSVP